MTDRKFKHIPSGKTVFDMRGDNILRSPYLRINWTIEEAENDTDLREILPNDRKQWFLDRIGKRVFRDYNGCPCSTCRRVTSEGLIISDTTHALELCGYEAETGIKYYDVKPTKK